MLLYIVRHAYAGERGDPRYPNDALRPLTKEGRRRFRCSVRKLVRRGFAPRLVVTSPLVRCAQTAEILVENCYESPELVELELLAPGAQLEPLVAWTRDRDMSEVAWVGHAPDVDLLAAGLISTPDAGIRFAKGAVAAIEFDGSLAAGEGQLRWLITAKMLGC